MPVGYLYSDCWDIEAESKMADGKALASAGTLVQCQAACIADTACVAVDWTDAGKSCLSHDTKTDTADEQGTSLYQLNRACAG